MRVLKLFLIKEFHQFSRDPKMFMVVLVVPVIQLIFLGYAANRDLNNVSTAILDNDKSAASRDFIDDFEKSGYFTIKYYADNYDNLTREIDDGNVLIGIVIGKDFEKKINTNSSADVLVIFDGSDGNKAAVAAGYVQTIASGFAKTIVLEKLEKSGMKEPLVASIEAETRIWYNPELLTRIFMLPGIVGLILIVITTSMTSLAIVKERELGTLEQLLVTPIKPYQMILGKLIPFSMIGLVSMTLVISVMTLWFGIAVKGSMTLLFLSSFVFMLSTLGLGMFVSTISKTQQQAMITAAFLIIMPMIFLSGFTFPIENMPLEIQYISYAVPLRYFLIIIRGIVIKGLGIGDLWEELLILFLMGATIMIASSFRFKKKLG